MKAHLNYLKYVLRHKWFVFLACLELRVPLFIAIFHDWDKFMPDEWLPYVHTFYAPDGTKQYKESVDFARAWMFHQHRNKHHWQYWLKVSALNEYGMIRDLSILVWDRGEAQKIVWRETVGGIRYELQPLEHVEFMPEPMPDVYRREMLADWRGAGKALGFPDTLEWYAKNRNKMILHPDTRNWIEDQLGFADFVEAVTNNVSVDEVRRQRAARKTSP